MSATRENHPTLDSPAGGQKNAPEQDFMHVLPVANLYRHRPEVRGAMNIKALKGVTNQSAERSFLDRLVYLPRPTSIF